jgi:DNA-binding transcriptional ArsR family regulator
MAAPFEVFHELGDPTRLTVLLAIVRGRKNVTEIVKELGLAQPQVSYHLKKLKDAGLASEEKDGRWVWYQANWDTGDARIHDLLDLLARWSGVPSATGGLGVACDDATCGPGVMSGGRGRGKGRGKRRVRQIEVPEDEPVTVERPKPSEDMDDFLL